MPDQCSVFSYQMPQLVLDKEVFYFACVHSGLNASRRDHGIIGASEPEVSATGVSSSCVGVCNS